MPSARKPLCMNNVNLVFMNLSGWKERKELPSNATLAHQKRRNKDLGFIFYNQNTSILLKIIEDSMIP